MKKLLLFLFLISMTPMVSAYSINAAAYKTMQMQAYQKRRNQMQQQRPIPYWQAQSNYATRNRVYRNYSDSLRRY